MPTLTRRRFLSALVVAASASVLPALPVHARDDRRVSRTLFPQSVASGDPRPDRVLLWTRVASTTPLALRLQVAEDAGFERLRAAGIAVASGLMETQARALNRGFLSRVERGRPWLRVKLACSLDGRTALANGESKWISSAASRADVMRWRARAGALLTGSGTVLADDPHLTVRLNDDAPFATPLRVVLDAGLATIARGNIRDAAAPTLYVHAHDTKVPRDFDAPRASVARDAAGQLDLAAVLALLGEVGINEIQVEAGATLSGAFLRAGLVDELLLYIAPVLLGERGRPLFDGLGIETMAQRLQMQTVETRRIGDDLRLLLRPSAP